MADPDLSIIVPVLNEQESLGTLHAEIAAVAKAHGLDLEVVFVDDGSTDGSWGQIAALAGSDPRVRGIRFRRNFGKAAAYQAAFDVVRGRQAVTLDADLQDDPSQIPLLLEKLNAGLGLVSGWKKVRHDPGHKVLASRAFNAMVSAVTDVHLHDHNCGMKGYRRELIRELRLYGEMHRFVPVLAAARGFPVGEVVIEHRPRRFGRSKYGLRRFLRGFLDMLTVTFLTRYGRRPMHLLGTLALAFLVGCALVAGVGLFWSPAVSGLTFLGILLGVTVPGMLLLHGLQAELTVAGHRDPPYSVAERVGQGWEAVAM